MKPRRHPNLILTAAATIATVVPLALVSAAPASAGTDGPAVRTPAANGGVRVAALGCHGGPALVDVRHTWGPPYSFSEGATRVTHSQWRISDANWAEVRTPIAGVTITLHRSDNSVCGPYTVHRFGGEYRARTGYLPNPGHGVWPCITFPGGRTLCGAQHFE